MSKTSRVVILTDLHLRSDYMPGFLETQIETLVDLANRKPCTHVVINGDVFERRNPRSEELLAFRQILESIKCKNIIVNRGNHDTLRKDGTSDTVLTLFSDLAHIVKDTETIRIGDIDFDFIPHYEDEDKIIQDLKKTNNPVFGHFGFDGCVSNGHYAYEARVKRWHFKKKPYAFLGHIHKPKIYDNVVILGTQYSNTFGEANAQKYVHELIIRGKEIEMVRKPMGKGIKHVVGTIDEIPELATKHKFEDFFTILRVKMDKLDTYTEDRLKEEIFAKYPIQHLELVFEDVMPKFESSYSPKKQIFTLDDSIINQYIEESDTIFSKNDLLKALGEIRNASQ
jgi:DNA repair exonuclease SbcCD nuclease subunit